MKRISLATVLVLSICAGAKAEDQDTMPNGRYLYEQCTSDLSWRDLICSAYISGVMQTVSFLGSVSPASVPKTCEDPEISIGEVKAEFLRWARAHQDELHRNAARLLIAASIDMHACPQARNTPKIIR